MNQINLNIENPCSENFSDFKTTKLGGFCNSCNKEVVDFTTMSPEEIVSYFEKKRIGKTCGRFKQDQLKVYNTNIISNQKKTYFFSRLTALFVALFSFSKAGAQEKTIEHKPPNNLSYNHQTLNEIITVKGIVLDEDELPLPGATIQLKNTNITTTTDLDGNFIFPEKLNVGDILVVNYIGYDTKEVTVYGNITNISLEITLGSCDLVLLGEVETKQVYRSTQD